jgi:hypothetical protein
MQAAVHIVRGVMRLEPKLWAERDPKVIPGAARKVDFVADFGPHPEMPPVTLNPDAGIHCKAGISGINVAEGLREALIAAGEVYEAHLSGRENVRASGAEVKLGSEKPMKRAGAGRDETGGQAIVEEVSLIALKVVRQFSFNAGPRIYLETDPATETHEIDGVDRVRIKAVKFAEGTDFHMVFGLGHS